MKRPVMRVFLVSAVLAALAVSTTTGEASTSAVSVGQAARTSRVALLRAFRHRVRAARAADGTPLQTLLANLGADPSSLQAPIRYEAGSDTVQLYLAHRGSAELCRIVVIDHAMGACDSMLREGNGEAGVHVSIMDGHTLIWGLLANDVQSGSVSVAGAAAFSSAVNISNNTFLAELPDGGRGSGAITLRLTRSNGAVVVVSLPGIPKPIVS